MHSGSNDSIHNYQPNGLIFGGNGNDKISLTSGNKNNVIHYNTGDGNDTIFTHTKSATIIGGTGNDLVENWDDNVGRFDDGEGKDVILMGAGNDSLRNFGSASTINAGAGNDHISLVGSSANNLIQYTAGDGNDKIFDYSSGDMLKILKSNGKEGGSFTKSTFKNGSLTLAISGGGNVIFDGVSNGDKFNINGKTYTLSGKSFK